MFSKKKLGGEVYVEDYRGCTLSAQPPEEPHGDRQGTSAQKTLEKWMSPSFSRSREEKDYSMSGLFSTL